MKLVVALKADIADCAVNVTIRRKVRVGRTTGTGEIAGVQTAKEGLVCYRSRRPKPQQNVAMGGKRIFSAPPNLRISLKAFLVKSRRQLARRPNFDAYGRAERKKITKNRSLRSRSLAPSLRTVCLIFAPS
jgi:hypothetical protein